MPIVLRFVQGTSVESRLIVAQEKTSMPFAPSHVEALTPDGFYLGSHISGGVEKRPIGYDKNEIADELILPLIGTDAMAPAFYAFLEKHIGEPYDWEAILGFLIPEHFHIANHVICSALITLGLRNPGWFPCKLSYPAHLVSPAILLFAISAKQYVPMVKQGDGWV